MKMNVLFSTFSFLVILKLGSGTVLEKYINGATPCENYCDATYNVSFSESGYLQYLAPCQKGCRLYTIIGLAKVEHSLNKTEALCLSACEEAYQNLSEANVKACYGGCKHEETEALKPQENPQTLHLLTPFMWVRSAYKTAVHNVRQLITTSFTLYVQEDSGKMVVLQTKPKTTILNIDEAVVPDIKPTNQGSNANSWQKDRTDWMECISRQSGLPRWILVSVLFGFIIGLLWLCCVTTVTAPSQYLSSVAKKLTPKNDLRYLYLYEPVDEFNVQPPSDSYIYPSDEEFNKSRPPSYTEAPPLPEKVNIAL